MSKRYEVEIIIYDSDMETSEKHSLRFNRLCYAYNQFSDYIRDYHNEEYIAFYASVWDSEDNNYKCEYFSSTDN